MEELFLLFSSIYPMSAPLVDYIKDKTHELTLSKKEMLLKKGHVNDYIYFIRKGLLRCYFEDKNGKEICAWFMNEGNVIISVPSFYNQKPTKHPIQAVEDCILYGMSYVDLQYAYDKYIEFNYPGRVLTERYYVLSEMRAGYLRGLNAPGRLMALLRMQPWLFDRISARHVASYIGISEEQLSRIRKKYQKEIGAIRS